MEVMIRRVRHMNRKRRKVLSYLFEIIKGGNNNFVTSSNQTHSSKELQNQCFCPKHTHIHTHTCKDRSVETKPFKTKTHCPLTWHSCC